MVGALVLLMAGTVLVQVPHLGQPPADLGTLAALSASSPRTVSANPAS